LLGSSRRTSRRGRSLKHNTDRLRSNQYSQDLNLSGSSHRTSRRGRSRRCKCIDRLKWSRCFPSFHHFRSSHRTSRQGSSRRRKCIDRLKWSRCFPSFHFRSSHMTSRRGRSRRRKCIDRLKWSRCSPSFHFRSSCTCSCRLRCSKYRLWSERVGEEAKFYYEFSYFLVLDSSARSFCSPGQTAQLGVESSHQHPLPAAQLLGHWATHTLNPA